MALIPKILDIFTTDPTTDPLYRFSNTFTYNGTLDRIETAGVATAQKFIEVLNSGHSYGTVEFDVHFTPGISAGTTKGFVRAFGYIFCAMFANNYVFDEENMDWMGFSDQGGQWVSTNAGGTRRPSLRTIPGSIKDTRRLIKFVSTPLGVSIYVDGIIKFVGPSRPRSLNMMVSTGASTESQAFYLYSISLNTDSALPGAPVIVFPAEAGSINVAQEVIATVPASRLFVDLGSYAPGITGLTNVIYDPGGANISMSPDTGIPTRSGGTTGDYYLEIPLNGVAYGYRLVIKEAFVLANSVVTSDSIDFDVTGGPAAQTGTVTEDDDLQCHVHVAQEDQSNLAAEKYLTELNVIPVIHNFNSDGNALNLNSGSIFGFFDNGSTDVSGPLSYSSSITFPVHFDFDLGKVYDIKRVNSIQDIINGNQITQFDIYSKTTPFSGAGVQGTLEYTAYPVGNVAGAANYFPYPAGLPQSPELTFSTRYIRFSVPSNSYFSGAISSVNYFPYEFGIKVVPAQSIDSVNDNADFEHDPGSGFVAFPGAGVTQGDGQVRITLPVALQVASGERKFISIQFKADLTD